jgi:hypothetical protein
MTRVDWSVLPLLTEDELRSAHIGAHENLIRILDAADEARKDLTALQKEIQRRETSDLETLI